MLHQNIFESMFQSPENTEDNDIGQQSGITHFTCYMMELYNKKSCVCVSLVTRCSVVHQGELMIFKDKKGVKCLFFVEVMDVFLIV